MTITYVDGQGLSASQLNLSFAAKMDVGGDASLLSALATGSSVPRALGDRFVDTINVLDYVPAPDGVSDNTARLQAAINAGANRARVLIPQTAFPFSVTGLTIPTNSCLIIDGTILQRPGATTSILRILTNAQNVSIIGDGMLDGNKANETTTLHAIEATGGSNIYLSKLTIQNTLLSPVFFTTVNQVLCDDMVILNCAAAMTFQNGCSNVLVRSTYSNASGADGIFFYGGATTCAVSDCNITASVGHGISVFHDTAQSVACNNLFFYNNSISTSGKTGIIANAGTGATGNHTNIQITNNRLTANNTLNVTGIGSVANKTGTYVRISDNQISKDGNGALASYAILVGGSDTQVVSNQISSVGQGGVLGVGIVLVNTANNVLISGNQIIDDQVTKTMNYGISGNAGTGVMIFNNQIGGMITAGSALVNAADTLAIDGASGTIQVTGAFATLGANADQSTVVAVPVTGFTTTIANGVSTYIMNPAGTLAAGTLTMPAAPIQGQAVKIMTAATITSFTLSANTSQTIGGAPTAASFAANQALNYIYSGTNWYRASSAAAASSYDPTSVAITGGTIASTPISGSTGAFTTLSASGAVSGAGFTARFAVPGPIGATTASTAAFTTLAASGAVSGAGFVALHASPGPIGSTLASTGAFSTLTASGAITLAGTVVNTVRIITAAGAVTGISTDRYIILLKTVAATTTVTLPPTPSTGQIVSIKDGSGNSQTFNISIVGASGATIDGVSTFTLAANFESVDVIWNGTQWNII